jgi:hypothetical protein
VRNTAGAGILCLIGLLCTRQTPGVGLTICYLAAEHLQVGALSAINGVAASYAEEIPVLSIVGGYSKQ